MLQTFNDLTIDPDNIEAISSPVESRYATIYLKRGREIHVSKETCEVLKKHLADFRRNHDP
jgi:hypothetical protein